MMRVNIITTGLVSAGLLMALSAPVLAGFNVPGPLAGAGLPAVIAAGGVLWIVQRIRRRRK